MMIGMFIPRVTNFKKAKSDNYKIINLTGGVIKLTHYVYVIPRMDAVALVG